MQSVLPHSRRPSIYVHPDTPQAQNIGKSPAVEPESARGGNPLPALMTFPEILLTVALWTSPRHSIGHSLQPTRQYVEIQERQDALAMGVDA